MTNLMGSKQPNAWIVSSRDKGRKKIYRGKETGHRKVYLQDGDKFEIELYNPTTTTVLAKILMDGKSISDSGIIVKAGQRIYLERYLDEDRSFKFETYDVEDTKEVRNAISNNGKVEVNFYNETVNYYGSGTITIGNNTWNGWSSNPYTYYGSTFTTNSAVGTSSPTSLFNVSSDVFTVNVPSDA